MRFETTTRVILTKEEEKHILETMKLLELIEKDCPDDLVAGEGERVSGVLEEFFDDYCN